MPPAAVAEVGGAPVLVAALAEALDEALGVAPLGAALAAALGVALGAALDAAPDRAAVRDLVEVAAMTIQTMIHGTGRIGKCRTSVS